MSTTPGPVMAMPFRKPPGLEIVIPPPPGLEQLFPSPAGSEQPQILRCNSSSLSSEGQPSLVRANISNISSCSTADTESGLGELLDSPAYIKGCACACEEYIPGRLLQRAAAREEVHPPQPPPPESLELETCVERPVASLPALLLNPGSAGHACGLCQPCEFFHRGRCTAGVDCKFCHFCGPNEAKERRKAKKAVMKRMGQVLAKQVFSGGR
jgi:hypothetical protein